jgi:hypothetical protein
MMRNPKRTGEVRSALQHVFPGSAAQKRCIELAQHIIRGKIMSSERVEPDDEREVKIGLSLTKPYRNALQLIARDRKFSMANYARKIMEEHISSVFPGLEKRNS